MSGEGSSFIANLRETRRILTDVSNLLRSADGMMEKAGWAAMTTTSRESAFTIEAPERWSPWTIFRFYKNDSNEHRVPYFAALLSDHPNREYKLKEPLASGGIFEVESKQALDVIKINWWYSQLYAYVGLNAEPNGSLIEIRDKERLRKMDYDGSINSATCFAWPLVTLKGPSDVEAKLTTPLLILL